MKMPDEIRKALRLLENECNNRVKCTDCPLWIGNECLVHDGSPIDWRLPREN